MIHDSPLRCFWFRFQSGFLSSIRSMETLVRPIPWKAPGRDTYAEFATTPTDVFGSKGVPERFSFLLGRLDSDAPGIVDAIQQNPNVVFGNVLIDGFSNALPVPVIVDNEHTLVLQPGEQMNHLVLG